MDTQRFKELLEKYLDETISPQEMQELSAYLQHPVYIEWLNQHMDAELKDRIYEMEPEEKIRSTIHSELNRRMEEESAEELPRISPWSVWKWGWAAIFILVAGTLIYLFFDKRETGAMPPVEIASARPAEPVIKPGTNKAILTLAGGKKIVLDEENTGLLAQEGGADINKIGKGEINYKAEAISGEKEELNTVLTPKAGQYKLTLSDGTRVWLNSASSMTFPAVFADNRRVVRVSGEVYFEVARDVNRPFVVELDQSSIEVLGTAFNVNSYANEPSVKTTLVHGKVKVLKGAASQLLAPGQQAIVADNIKLAREIDVDQVIAWKHGLFNFNDADLPGLMRQLERWYDIEVKVEGAYPEVRFQGKMYRNENLSTILRFLSENGLKFRVDGKTVILEGKNKK